ncbi:hypothetical protein RKD20_001107 [Streptomyces sp. SLBN-8D4]|jgi:hypothetical protein
MAPTVILPPGYGRPVVGEDFLGAHPLGYVPVRLRACRELSGNIRLARDHLGNRHDRPSST